MAIETEAKFRVGDFEPLRKKLRAIGAKKISSVFEHNIAFDDKSETLRKSDRLLRVRHDKKTTMTYKGPKLAQDLKAREELEIEISDFDTAKKLFLSLGFTNTLIYEKKRETWKMKSTKIELDELPFGRFVEIEGNSENIISISEKLGFSKKDIITKTYFELAEEAGIKGDIIFKKSRKSLCVPRLKRRGLLGFSGLRTSRSAVNCGASTVQSDS